MRRLADARGALLSGLEHELLQRIGIEKDELAGLLHLVRSQLDLSLVRLLHETLT